VLRAPRSRERRRRRPALAGTVMSSARAVRGTEDDDRRTSTGPRPRRRRRRRRPRPRHARPRRRRRRPRPRHARPSGGGGGDDDGRRTCSSLRPRRRRRHRRHPRRLPPLRGPGVVLRRVHALAAASARPQLRGAGHSAASYATALTGARRERPRRLPRYGPPAAARATRLARASSAPPIRCAPVLARGGNKNKSSYRASRFFSCHRPSAPHAFRQPLVPSGPRNTSQPLPARPASTLACLGGALPRRVHPCSGGGIGCSHPCLQPKATRAPSNHTTTTGRHRTVTAAAAAGPAAHHQANRSHSTTGHVPFRTDRMHSDTPRSPTGTHAADASRRSVGPSRNFPEASQHHTHSTTPPADRCHPGVKARRHLGEPSRRFAKRRRHAEPRARTGPRPDQLHSHTHAPPAGSPTPSQRPHNSTVTPNVRSDTSNRPIE